MHDTDDEIPEGLRDAVPALLSRIPSAVDDDGDRVTLPLRRVAEIGCALRAPSPPLGTTD